MLMLLTNHEDMGDGDEPEYRQSKLVPYNFEQAVAHLDQSPHNAVEIHVVDKVAIVWCGAGEDSTNYFWDIGPLSDPNDASGGDLTSNEAMAEAAGQMKRISKK